VAQPSFEWDGRKDAENQSKHGVPFVVAQHAFADPHRVIAEDTMCTAPRSGGTSASGVSRAAF